MPNVIVVDRSPNVRRNLSSALTASREDLAVIACDGSESALDVLRTTPVDVVVVDGRLNTAAGALAVLLAAAARNRGAVALVRGESGEGAGVDDGIGRVAAREGDLSPLVDAVVSCVAEPGSRGRPLGDLSLGALVAQMSRDGWSGALALRDGRRAGALGVSAGAVTHASFGGLSGDAAAELILSLEGGTLTELDAPGLAHNVTLSTAELLGRAETARAGRGSDGALEITEEDLVDFMGLSAAAPVEDAFQLFSAEELAELALDDTMAIPLRRAAPGANQPPPVPPTDDE